MTSTTAKELYSLDGKRIWVAGHRGMVGSALVRRLGREACQVLTAGRDELDCTRQADVEAWMERNRPQAVVIAAAKVGGIHANSHYPAEFLYRNLAIETNIIHAAWRTGVEKLLFLGSSCIYPRLAPQPLTEDMLLTGPLEPTNEWYAVAKIAGIKMCDAYRRQYGCDFISVMPTNLLGPGDNYDPQNSHVVAALISRCHKAKVEGTPEVVLWGTGSPKREFMHVDDAADAMVFLLRHHSGEGFLNLGTGQEITIRDFAGMVAEVVGYTGQFRLDTTKPDGTPRKVMDVSRLAALGWTSRIDLRQGLADAYAWYLANVAGRTG
ncbi:MAG: GDP-L-fucose synthase [Alphaproteobacteria bacterium]